MTKDEYLKMIGRRIRFYREQAGMSQEELASRTGYTSNNPRSTISKIELGKNDFPQSKVVLFAKAFGISVAELVDVQQDPEELRICDLFEQCYGKDSYSVVQKYLHLSSDHQESVRDLVDMLAAKEKKVESSKEKAIS